MAVKVFVFDCGGVLLRDRDASAYESWEGRLGLERGELRERLWSGEAWNLAERGLITEEQFWLRVGRDLGLTESEDISALRQEMWDIWVVDEKVLSLVDRLREKYRVAMLSNATDALEEALENRYGIADRFEAILNSARLGLAKPEEGIYAEMLRRLAVEPGEVVFVDDREENIAAAVALGMLVIWFVHPDELARQLAIHLNREDGDRGTVRDAGGESSQPEE